MSFTSKDDINFIQASDAGTVGAGGGNDIYVVWPSLLTDNQIVVIRDTEGVNTLRLAEGMTITNCLVAATAMLLTFSNGAQVTLMGAASFSFAFGGDAFGEGEVVQNFQTFVTDSLGLAAVPTGTAQVDVGQVEIGAGEVHVEGEGNEIAIPIGSTGTFTGTEDADTFTFDAVAALSAVGVVSQAIVDSFDVAEDEFEFNLPNATGATTLAALDGQQGVGVEPNPFTGDFLVTFGNDADGEVVVVTLSGISDASLVDVVIV